MTNLMKTRVASVDDEERLLPPNIARHMESPYEPVFMVTTHEDGTESIDGGSVIDTEKDLYFEFVIFADTVPNRAEAMPTTDWLPLPDPE